MKPPWYIKTIRFSTKNREWTFRVNKFWYLYQAVKMYLQKKLSK